MRPLDEDFEPGVAAKALHPVSFPFRIEITSLAFWTACSFPLVDCGRDASYCSF
jgi:hypothetical protein